MECIPYTKIGREKNPPYLSRFYFYFIIFYSLGHKLIRTSFAGRQKGFGYTVFEMQLDVKRDRELYHTGQSVGLRPGERPGTQLGHEILETGLCESTQRL